MAQLRPAASQLEALARATLGSESTNLIARVLDQNLGFVALEPDLFSLGQPDSYATYHGTDDAAVEAHMRDVAQGLFAVLATLDVVPVLRCPAGGPAEAVARALDRLLRDHIAQRKASSAGFGVAASNMAPLLNVPLLAYFSVF